MSPYQDYQAQMEAAGWKKVLGKPGCFNVWKRNGLTVIQRYVYLAYCWTGRIPEWAL